VPPGVICKHNKGYRETAYAPTLANGPISSDDSAKSHGMHRLGGKRIESKAQANA
jgi:hypothetical protein